VTRRSSSAGTSILKFGDHVVRPWIGIVLSTFHSGSRSANGSKPEIGDLNFGRPPSGATGQVLGESWICVRTKGIYSFGSFRPPARIIS